MTIPATWATARIGDLCHLVNGRAFKPGDWSDQGLPIIRIQNLKNQEAKFNHYRGSVESKFLVEPGELLFAWSGTPGTSFGAHVWSGPQAILNQHIFRVLFNSHHLSRDFFRLAINSRLDELIGKAHGGVGLAHVTRGKFESTEVHLPPLAEQCRIVAAIEALAARSKRAKAELVRVEALSSRAKQAVLVAAFRGELTADWRDQHPSDLPAATLVDATAEPDQSRGGREATTDVIPGLAAVSVNNPGTPTPQGWAWVRLRRIARQETGHTPSRSRPEYWDGGVPWIGIRDAGAHHSATINDTIQTISETGLANSSARLLPAGTVCLSRTASVGYVTIMGRPMATSQDFATWTCTDALDPEYLMFALLAEGDHIRTFGEGTTHTTIYFPEIRAFHICLAPKREQVEIVRRVKLALAKIDKMAEEARASLAGC